MFINITESVGVILNHGTINTTGSIFITLMIILLVLMAFAMMFQLPLEYTAIVIFPLVLSYMAYYSEWIATGSIILIFFSMILTKNFIFK